MADDELFSNEALHRWMGGQEPPTEQQQKILDAMFQTAVDLMSQFYHKLYKAGFRQEFCEDITRDYWYDSIMPMLSSRAEDDD